MGIPFVCTSSLLLKPDGKGKLSKRDGDGWDSGISMFWPYGETATGYREEGYYRRLS
jgi:hypothetical protein